ncbi:MAG: Spx/MgsR family RNA polymerase-binding regulatory protein [Acholeplasmatales bacterium]|nr:Spx/MgsR family RNA polymerase-binding regulatory protein [Acholeplasmatales bacterium]
MYKVYCYNKCSTCQKALKFLNENNIKYEFIDIKENNPNKEILKEIHLKSKKELKKLFNTSGLLYKEYELSKKIPNMTEDEMYELLSSNGMLVKRPILIGDDFSLIGFKEDEWKKLK